ncbi:hypothetical protein SANTM175S_08393 [Streptomyces antimycoticus]
MYLNLLDHGPLLDVFVLDMRTYRNANSPDDQTTDPQGILGREQLEWLKRELARSRAVWKAIASDMPLGLLVPDTGDGKPNLEAVAQGDPGAPLGRELQIAELLRFIKHRRITRTVWLTADVHHTSAQHYDPSRAAFKDFAPFWEFVSGPLNAGAFPANTLDRTFGPDRVFVKAPTTANVSPAGGYQFFGEVDIDDDSGELTVLAAPAGRHGAVHPGAPAGPGRPVALCGAVRGPVRNTHGAADRAARGSQREIRGAGREAARQRLPSRMTRATSAGSSFMGTWPQPGSRTSRAPGMTRLARTPWRRGSTRSREPQAMVTGISGMSCVNSSESPAASVASKPTASRIARVSATTAAGERRAGRA